MSRPGERQRVGGGKSYISSGRWGDISSSIVWDSCSKPQPYRTLVFPLSLSFHLLSAAATHRGRADPRDGVCAATPTAYLHDRVRSCAAPLPRTATASHDRRTGSSSGRRGSSLAAPRADARLPRATLFPPCPRGAAAGRSSLVGGGPKVEERAKKSWFFPWKCWNIMRKCWSTIL
jgi:hypothetical protein